MKAVITIGIAASGKSTLAREWVSQGKDWTHKGDGYTAWGKDRVEINRDSIRRSIMERDGKVFSWDKWNWKREKEVTTIAWEHIKDCALAGYDIIISDTNLNAARRNTLMQDLEFIGYEVQVMEFPITLEEAWKRDAARENGVGQSVIAEQYEKWLEYVGRKRYVADQSKPKCILVDIDGTLAHMNGKRGAFEWDKVDQDDCDEMVKTVVNGTPKEWLIIVLSGRDGICRFKTSGWLEQNGILYDKLIMRKQGDMRKDTIVKEEIFWRDIAANYSVQFVIDDRPCVVRLWQRIGLKTFAVGNQHIEF